MALFGELSMRAMMPAVASPSPAKFTRRAATSKSPASRVRWTNWNWSLPLRLRPAPAPVILKVFWSRVWLPARAGSPTPASFHSPRVDLSCKSFRDADSAGVCNGEDGSATWDFSTAHTVLAARTSTTRMPRIVLVLLIMVCVLCRIACWFRPESVVLDHCPLAAVIASTAGTPRDASGP